jgi:hypothetical protein
MHRKHAIKTEHAHHLTGADGARRVQVRIDSYGELVHAHSDRASYVMLVVDYLSLSKMRPPEILKQGGGSHRETIIEDTGPRVRVEPARTGIKPIA